MENEKPNTIPAEEAASGDSPSVPPCLRGEYCLSPDGIFVPRAGVQHRDDEYDSADFDILLDMQRRHFWYLGRHRFLLRALKSFLPTRAGDAKPPDLSGIDLGGGCGGWISYLQQHLPGVFAELALSDSSTRALELARPVVGPGVQRYQADLLDLGWRERWDVAFLLDVLEHIPADGDVLQQIWLALKPGGSLLVTTPALPFFWSHNDEMAHHVRRYSRGDFARLAASAGFEMSLSRYFNFFLSGLLLVSRMKTVDVAAMSKQQILAYMKKTHRVPPAPINLPLAAVFAMETPIGHWLPFPWGTSVLGVFRKPL